MKMFITILLLQGTGNRDCNWPIIGARGPPPLGISPTGRKPRRPHTAPHHGRTAWKAALTIAHSPASPPRITTAAAQTTTTVPAEISHHLHEQGNKHSMLGHYNNYQGLRVSIRKKCLVSRSCKQFLHCETSYGRNEESYHFRLDCLCCWLKSEYHPRSTNSIWQNSLKIHKYRTGCFG